VTAYHRGMRAIFVCLGFMMLVAAGRSAEPPAPAQPLFLNQTQAAWLRDLQSANPSRRQAAAFALGYFAQVPGEVVAALVSALADEDRFVRETAAQSLAELGPAAGDVADAVLRRLQQEPDPTVARALMHTLARLTPWSGPAAAELRKRAGDPDPLTRQAAVAALRALGRAAGVESLALLRRLVNDPDEGVRLEAARAIGMLPLTAADGEALLASLLGSEDVLVLVELAALISRLGSAGQGLAARLRQRAEAWPEADPRRAAVLTALRRPEAQRQPPAQPPAATVPELLEQWRQRGPALARRLTAEGILLAEDEHWLRQFIAAGSDERLRPMLEELARWHDVPDLARAARERLGK